MTIRSFLHANETAERRMPIQPSRPGLVLYLSAAKCVHPGSSGRALRNRLRYIALVLKQHRPLTAWLRQPAQRALVRELLARPELLGCIVWPYVHARWSMMQRFEALSQHHQAIDSDMSALALAADGSRLVADLSDISTGLRLVVDRAPWFLREGSLVLNQFLHGERLMSLAFSFGRQDGERVAYVGSVQGAKADSALATYRKIARDLHGMRSRDFLIKAFQLLAHHLGVKRVLCVDEQARHHRHPYFGKFKSEELHLNYDTMWQEHGGVPMADGFFRLGALPRERRWDEIAAKNRSLYRHRYALMDVLSADIAERLRTPPLPLLPEAGHP